MKKSLYIFIAFALLISCTQKPSEENQDQWQVLFDGTSLDGWDTYLGPRFAPGVTWDSIHNYPPVGLNVDTTHVFSIVDMDGEKVMRISGEVIGGISTKQEFENFHLQLKMKWGEKKWYPRNTDNDKRDSGILYYASGPQGAGSGFWLSSQEFQIQEGDCGDYWAVARSIFDIKATLINDSIYQYDPQGELVALGNGKPAGNYCKKLTTNEKPHGEWNIMDLYCFKDKSIHVVNGKVVMRLENSRELVEGKEVPLTKGKIQIQSEAAEVYYKDIKIEPIDSLPTL